MRPSGNDSSPTPAQLRYLRALAEQTGTTFSLPRTPAQASCEIERLKQLKASRRRHLESPREGDPREQPYATALHSSEVTGFGSTAAWRASPPPALRAPARKSAVGERTELARYRVSSGERVLHGQRIAGCVRITDRPAAGGGRAYLVERELERDGYGALKALVTDYLEQARELDTIPMASSSLGSQLQGLKQAS
jgi:hypothetical protein